MQYELKPRFASEPVILYYHPGATSFAVHVTLLEIGAEVELHRIDLNKDEQKTPSFLAVNPHGKVPVLRIGGERLTETPALLAYLASRADEPQLLPAPGTVQYARALQWLAWLCSSVHISFAQIFFPARFSTHPAAAAAMAETARCALVTAFDEIEDRLVTPWVLGERFSVVDPYLLVFCRFAQLLELPVTRKRPKLTAWAGRAVQRPSVIAAMRREGVQFTAA